MEWGGGFSVSELVVSCGSYGGPMAVSWPCNFHNSVHPSNAGVNYIYIFNAAGVKMAAIKWTSGELISLGWSQMEELLCIQRDGSVTLYNMHGAYLYTFSMGQEVKDMGVIAGSVFDNIGGSGVCVISAGNRVYVTAHVKEGKARRFADLPGASAVLCWSVARQDRHLSVLVSTAAGIFCLTAACCTQMQAPLDAKGHDCVALSVSLDGSKAAALFGNGVLWLGATDFGEAGTSYDTKTSVKPRQMVGFFTSLDTKTSVKPRQMVGFVTSLDTNSTVELRPK